MVVLAVELFLAHPPLSEGPQKAISGDYPNSVYCVGSWRQLLTDGSLLFMSSGGDDLACLYHWPNVMTRGFLGRWMLASIQLSPYGSLLIADRCRWRRWLA
jgi:hypothetical protein